MVAEEASPRSQVHRVKVDANGIRRIYWHTWISVCLETREVEIYEHPDGGEPLARFPAHQVTIDWRAAPGVP